MNKKRFGLTLIVVLIILFNGCYISPFENHYLMIILDLSVSMDERLEDTKRSLCKFIENDIPRSFHIGLRVFSSGTERVYDIRPQKNDVEIIKRAIMRLRSIGGTNFTSILHELPDDFRRFHGNYYVLVAGDGQYGNIYDKVIECRLQLERYGKVTGIGFGIDLSPSEQDNIDKIAYHLTSIDNSHIFVNVESESNFFNLSSAFYKINYALLIIYRIIAFIICLFISYFLVVMIYELSTKTFCISPQISAVLASLIFPFFILIAFLFYLSDIAGDYINTVAALLYCGCTALYLFSNLNVIFHQERKESTWEKTDILWD